MNPEDSRIQTTWENSKECFAKSINLFPYDVKTIEIPYEETTLPGHFYHYKSKKRKRRITTKNDNVEKDNNSSISKLSSCNSSSSYPTLHSSWWF